MPKRTELVTAKISPSEIRAWVKRVNKAREERKRHEDTWDLLLESYKPRVERMGDPEDVKTNAHFRNVEQKKALLFFRTPELRLTPKEPLSQTIGQDQNGQPITAETAVPIKEAVLREKLGPAGVNLPLLMDRVLFDCLCPSGFMVSKIGYVPHLTTVQQPVMATMPMPTGRIGLDGAPEVELQEVPTGEMEDVPVIVKEEYFWERVSPKKLLIPADFKDTHFDKSPWLGVEFLIPLRKAKRLYDLPQDFEPARNEDEMLLGEHNKGDRPVEQMVKGQEIFYKAAQYRDDVVNPDVCYQLVLLEGHKDKNEQAAAVHRISPYQQLAPETGQLTPDSMLGNPIHVGTIRDLSDSAYVPSDCAMTHTQVKEMDVYRQQSVKLRDAQLLKLGYDTDKFTPEARKAFQSGDVGQWIPLEGGALAGGKDSVVVDLSPNKGNRVDMDSAFLLGQDMEKTLAIGSNQAGSQTDSARTATELSLIQSNSNVRMEKEQGRVLEYVLSGVRKFDSLLQRFADNDELVEIVGDDGVRRLATWNKDVIAGRYAYDIQPDSQIRLDAAVERNLHMQFYNLTAQDPYNVRKESLKKLQTLFGIDPAKGITEPPPPGPPPPNVSFRFSGDDFIGAAAPIVMEIAKQAGYNISPEARQQSAQLAVQEALLGAQEEAEGQRQQPSHPGSAERLPAISKGQGERTGSLPGPTSAGKTAL